MAVGAWLDSGAGTVAPYGHELRRAAPHAPGTPQRVRTRPMRVHRRLPAVVTGGVGRKEWRPCAHWASQLLCNTAASPAPRVRLARRNPVHCIQIQPWTAGARLEDSAATNGPTSLLTSGGPGFDSGALLRVLSTRRRVWTPPYASQHVAKSPADRPGCGRWRRVGGLGAGLGLALLWWRSPPAFTPRGGRAALLLQHLRGGSEQQPATMRGAAASESMARCHHSAAALRAKR